jgi:hypothetical protein
MAPTDDSGIRLVDYAMGALIAVVGFVGRHTVHRVDRLESEGRNYSSREDITQLRQEMTEQHARIQSRLDEIADRIGK